MSNSLKPAIAIIVLTVVIGTALWLTGIRPVPDSPDGAQGSLRAFLNFPLAWTVVGGSLLALAVAMKSRNFSGGKSDAIPAMTILTGPLAALICQILVPLIAHDMVSKGQANMVFVAAIALFYLVVGNVIGLAPFESRLGLRNQWTLSDPDIWRRVHRFLGRNLVISTLFATPVALLLVPGKAQWMVLGAAFLVKAASYQYARILGLQRMTKAPGQARS